MRMKLLDVEFVGKDTVVKISISYTRWLKKDTVREYTVRGSGTSWHFFPDGTRVPSTIALDIMDLLKAKEWSDEK